MRRADGAKNIIRTRWKNNLAIPRLSKRFLRGKNGKNEKWTQQIDNKMQAARDKSIGIDQNCKK